MSKYHIKYTASFAIKNGNFFFPVVIYNFGGYKTDFLETFIFFLFLIKHVAASHVSPFYSSVDGNLHI